jgi:lipid-A-disaccharide synthase-like uncharacterized protein
MVMNVASITKWWATTPTSQIAWVTVGLIAQSMFALRFIIQWLATEKARATIVPEMFWYFSFAGGFILLAYAIDRMDPVFIVGQAIGLVIYIRNIYFIRLGKRNPSQAEEVGII